MNKQPIPVWIITIYFGVSSLWGLWLYLSALLGVPGIPVEVASQFENYGSLDFGLLIFQHILTLVVCFFLFALKKVSLQLIAFTAAYLTISTIWFSTQPQVSGNLGVQAFLIVNLLFVGVWIAIWFYARHLRARKVID